MQSDTPRADRDPCANIVPGKPFRTLWNYNRVYKKEYGLGAVLSLIFIIVGLAMPLVVRAVVRDFNEDTMTSAKLWLYFGMLVAIASTTGIARFFQRIFMIGASRRFEYELRNDYFRHVQRLSQDFFNRVKTGDIMARATNDLNYVRLLIGPGIMGTVDLVQIPFALGLMLALSARLTLISLIPMPIFTVLIYLFVMYMHYQSKKVQAQFADITSRAQENLVGARVVKAYGAIEREERAFRRESEKYMWHNLKLAIVMNLLWPVIGLIMGLVMLLLLWRGGTMVIEQRMPLEDLLAFMGYIGMMMFPLVRFGWVLTLYQRGTVGMQRIIDFMVVKPSIQDTDATRNDIVSLDGGIDFENVSLAYPYYEHDEDDDRPPVPDPDAPHQEVLHQLNFAIGRGRTVAFVGATGSGKSSIVTLVTRQYDPTKGRVLLDGIDAREVPVQVLRDAIGVVPQDTFLFSDSIRNNLCFGKPEATEEQMLEASKAAQFHETVADLPDGYDTLLGERGVNLSGGQKQRLAIARALIRNPRILILDDALSSVDTHTEELILARLKEIMKERTSIIIAHRISTVQHAECIYVLDAGRIVESGTHAELLALQGPYARMYERQLLEEELEQR